MNPLIRAHRLARKAERELGELFDRYLGSSDHPRGRTTSAIRQARRSLWSVFYSGVYGSSLDRQVAALDVLRDLRDSLNTVGALAIPVAIRIGQDSARQQTEAYQEAGVVLGEGVPAQEAPSVAALTRGWSVNVSAFVDPLNVLVLSDAEPAMFLGDEDRIGAITTQGFNPGASVWLTTAVSTAFLLWLLGRRAIDEPEKVQVTFRKQAIAAIDARTTFCCLDVHGQVQPFNKPFELREPPRFADRMMWSPFHGYCRTVIALYVPEFDDELTDRLLRDAELERGRRK